MSEEHNIVIAAESGIFIDSINDVSNAIGQCFGSQGLLITEVELSPDFFNLHSGIAGELFQKCTNYGLRLAIVLNDFNSYGERFSELIYEHRKHSLIRFFHSQVEAQHWLL